MFTRLIQRKRPRRSVLLAIGAAALAAIGLIVAVAIAVTQYDTGTGSPSFTGNCDVTVASNNSSADCQLGAAGGFVSYIGSNDTARQASGTGLFDPFVRLQGSPTEQGFNTDAPVTFDAKTGTWTHAIKVNAIPIVACNRFTGDSARCWELFVDINDSNTAKRISLNKVQIFFTNSSVLSGYTSGPPPAFSSPSGNVTTEEYDFNGNILINDVNSGSGRGDLRYRVPIAGHTWDSTTWFVLYSQWGTTSGTAGNFGSGGYTSDGGFEEWKVKKTPNVSITKTADAASVNAGSSIGFTITVTNSGVADATGVTISDSLPGGTGLSPVHWAESPDNSNCTITGGDGSQVLSCGPVTLAASGGSLSVHVSASTTAANCGTYDNTATFTSTNAGSGSASASIAVNCGALMIKKESTKGTNPLVLNAGAVFSVAGPSPSTTSFNVTDDTTAAAPDEDALAGEVCVSGLAPGTYTINEVSPPTGYGAASASQANQSVTVANGTNCTTSKPGTGATATFTNAPLYDLQVNFKDDGSGETSATISCSPLEPPDSTAPPSPYTTSSTYTSRSAPQTVTCTITVDP